MLEDIYNINIDNESFKDNIKIEESSKKNIIIGEEKKLDYITFKNIKPKKIKKLR